LKEDKWCPWDKFFFWAATLHCNGKLSFIMLKLVGQGSINQKVEGRNGRKRAAPLLPFAPLGNQSKLRS